MFDSIDDRFNYLTEILSKHDGNLEIVRKAYEKAKELHYYHCYST